MTAAPSHPVVPRATVKQCVILVGGLGTRLGELTATTPKPLMPCGDRPFLAWLMREMQRYGVEEFLLLGGHLSEEIERAIDDLQRFLPKPARIVLSVEPHRAGTGGALFHAQAHLHERFLLCNGDSLFDFNLGSLLSQAARASYGSGWMALRALTDTGRYGVVTLAADGDQVVRFEPSSSAGHPGLINAGVYLLDRRVLDHVTPSCSLEADVLPRLAAEGTLHGIVGAGPFRDIGIPDDLARARTELPAQLHRPALFLDRDGVINHDHGWVGTRERFTWTPDGREALRAACNAGWHVFVVTNQSGIARGLYSEAQLDELHRWMIDEIHLFGGTIDDIRFCPDHEEAVVERYRRRNAWRKPEPGMILDLMKSWELDPERCTIIGDQQTDLQAGQAAGIAAYLTQGGDLMSLLSKAGIGAGALE